MTGGWAYPGKRWLDVAGSLVGLVLTLPLTALIALAIKLEDRGPGLYVQDRLGYGGEPFRLLKFRSMVVGADRMADGYRIRRGDERITRVGRILRRFSLDELPQLVNVLRGEMSLVGPRPALLRDLERYSERERRRLDVRPGITGLAQISGRASIPWRERISYDLDYVDRASFLLDLKILATTVARLFAERDVYPSQDPWTPDATGDGSPDSDGDARG